MWNKEDHDTLNNLWENSINKFCTNTEPKYAALALIRLGKNICLGVREFTLPDKDILMVIVNLALKHIEYTQKKYEREKVSNNQLAIWVDAIHLIRVSISSMMCIDPNILSSSEGNLKLWDKELDMWEDIIIKKMKSNFYIIPDKKIKVKLPDK